MVKDFLDEIMEESTRRNPEYPQMFQKAWERVQARYKNKEVSKGQVMHYMHVHHAPNDARGFTVVPRKHGGNVTFQDIEDADPVPTRR